MSLPGDPKERALAPGDFVFQNETEKRIEIYPGDGPLTDGKIPDYANDIGVVVTVAPGRMTDDKLNDAGWNHAYVMGLKNTNIYAHWGEYMDETAIPNTPLEQVENNMNGYTETEAMLDAHKGDLNLYGAFDAISKYRIAFPVPQGLSRSPWFVPSAGQWFDVMANICGRSPKTFRDPNPETPNWWIDNSYGPEMRNAINSQSNKVVNKPVVNDIIWFYCSSENNFYLFKLFAC